MNNMITFHEQNVCDPRIQFPNGRISKSICESNSDLPYSLSEDIYKIVKTHKEIRWSEIARRAIEDYAKKVTLLNAMTAKSELTEEDIIMLDEKIKSDVQQHYKSKEAGIRGRKPE